jgi:hypothetical protein
MGDSGYLILILWPSEINRLSLSIDTREEVLCVG